MLQGLTIRAAAPEDREALLRQFEALNSFEDALTGDRAPGRAGAEASLAASERRIAEAGGHRLVAVRQGAVLGHLFLVFSRLPPFVREEMQAHAYVSELFIEPDARGAGIGRALLAEAERLARAAGLRRMLISVVAGNERAERTYLQAGFAPYARELMKPLD